MTEVLSVTRALQLGVEVTPGTNVPATKRMQTLMYTSDPKETAEELVPAGQVLETVMVLSKQWTEGSITGKPSYGELNYPLAMLLGAPTITTPGGGITARQSRWNMYGNVAITPQTFAAESGDATESEIVDFLHAVSLSLDFDRSKIALTAKTVGQKTNFAGSFTTLTGVNAVQTLTMTGTPTGGTFTLTFRGQTTTALAYNAAASVVQAALVALSTIGTGNVVCTGGALPGTPVVATFGGNLGNQPITLMTASSASLTGGSTPTMTPTTTTAGVSTTPEPVAVPLVPNQIDIYVDNSAGALGTTQFLRDFEAKLDISDTQDQVYPLNSSLASFGAIAPKVPKPMVSLTVAQDAQGLGLITALRAGTRKFIRIVATGGILEGAIHYSATFDMAVDLKSIGSTKSVSGIHSREMQGQIAHDYAWGQGAMITLVSTVASLT